MGAEMTRPEGERLAIVETKIDALKTQVDGMERTLGELRNDFQQRQGAERIAKWLIGLGSGSFSAAVIAALSKLGLIGGAFPIK